MLTRASPHVLQNLKAACWYTVSKVRIVLQLSQRCTSADER